MLSNCTDIVSKVFSADNSLVSERLIGLWNKDVTTSSTEFIAFRRLSIAFLCECDRILNVTYTVEVSGCENTALHSSPALDPSDLRDLKGQPGIVGITLGRYSFVNKIFLSCVFTN